MLRSLGWCALAALVAVGVTAPGAAAMDCDNKIHVYGRALVVPGGPPPHAAATAGTCVRLLNQGALDTHRLPPNTDHVMVRLQADFGPSVEQVEARLDGLGFVDSVHLLQRTTSALGGVTYNLPMWLPLPDGPVDGPLVVTVTLPGGVVRTVTYSTTATLVPPPVPAP